MEIHQTELSGVLLLKPPVFRDSRGFFLESWNKKRFDEALGRSVEFVQDNHSRSARGVLRGLHYQESPMAQAKLVSVMRGTIYDVAVDLRPDSPSRGKWVGEFLSDEKRETLWIPEGFAHGFLVVSDYADVVYKTTNYYSPQHERCILWSDAAVGIPWPLHGLTPLVSDKDLLGAAFTP